MIIKLSYWNFFTHKTTHLFRGIEYYIKFRITFSQLPQKEGFQNLHTLQLPHQKRHASQDTGYRSVRARVHLPLTTLVYLFSSNKYLIYFLTSYLKCLNVKWIIMTLYFVLEIIKESVHQPLQQRE